MLVSLQVTVETDGESVAALLQNRQEWPYNIQTEWECCNNKSLTVD